ncbi:hypothetical protein BUALT_Bualt01G0117300 [Buddleja alternifolia]|uniref:Protein LURP-one-related 8 n=1 Tax=Buddleja alternifolia TaxID=168488 RepID=A0AAV6Y8Q1_9LAMI|nr:hypothetical protein BUALT_Bualt01G0117300 [Buddleja alternifolia]
MTKVFPNATTAALPSDPCCIINGCKDADPTVLTVWKKSLLLNCDGFTVFDAHGNLVYRVDNYISGNKAEIKMSLGDSWLVFDGETADNPRFLVKKNVNLLKTKCLAHVSSAPKHEEKMSSYEIEGSYAQRCCAVYDEKRRLVAEIKHKESPVRGVAFGTDIFRLIVQPGFDTALAMAIVILLDQMFGSSTSRRPRLSTNSFYR